MGIKVEYINSFFSNFIVSEDLKEEHFYTLYLKESILEFLRDETKSKAMAVYETFFDTYKLKINDEFNFVDLLDVLKSYEENASTLIDKQRDHFIHSVNVFLLGLSIYALNPKFQETYNMFKVKEDSIEGKADYIEKFFFEWGLASLCHDIGYPIEITNNQIKKFSDIITRAASTGMKSKPYVDFKNFDAINGFVNGIEEVEGNRPLDLLTAYISQVLNVDNEELNKALYNFPEIMKENGFVDHGYYSSLILLKWYAYFSQLSNDSKGFSLKSTISASSAILLHNYYKNAIMKEPFNLELLKAEDHPLSYLLILCDELQDWNREAYGIEDKKKAAVEKSRIDINEDIIEVAYLVFDGEVGAEYKDKKINSIYKVIDLFEIFKNGLNVNVMTMSDLYIEEITTTEDKIQPRLLIENIEKLAKMIHDDYNKKQLLRNPDEELTYPTWESLPQTLKYSNIRQAREMTRKLNKLGYMAIEDSEDYEEITTLSHREVEYLARIEHDSWVKERVQNGWQFGLKRDVEKKLSPYIVPYDDLTEEIKELDRDAVRNIIPLLNKINLKVYKVKSTNN